MSSLYLSYEKILKVPAWHKDCLYSEGVVMILNCDPRLFVQVKGHCKRMILSFVHLCKFKVTGRKNDESVTFQ